MSLAQAEEHQRRHGFSVAGLGSVKTAEKAPGDSKGVLALPVKMTRPEKEYGLILEAMKRKGEIVDYKPWGTKLAWGKDPKTGRLMYYTGDFLVIKKWGPMLYAVTHGPKGKGRSEIWDPAAMVIIIEVKGAHIWPKDLIRFKGCRSEWPMFQFEMHQLEKGVWTRIQ